MGGQDPSTSAGGDRHFACTLSSVLVRRLRRTHGEEGLARLLELAGSERTVAYLDELTNWISYDEAMALFRAAEEITGDPRIARRVGEETIAQHAGTPVATLMRSLGSPEEIYRQITQAGSKFTTASVLEAPEVEPGRAVIRERAVRRLRADGPALRLGEGPPEPADRPVRAAPRDRRGVGLPGARRRGLRLRDQLGCRARRPDLRPGPARDRARGPTSAR